MRSVLDELAAQLRDVRSLLASIDPVNAVLAPHTDNVVSQYLNIRRRFDYSIFVVAIYAAMERFIEGLVCDYARLLTTFTSYDQLPQSLTSQHLLKTGDLLSRGKAGKGRHTDVSEKELIKNLFDCISGASEYRLNYGAIVAHERNLRWDEISALLSTIGVSHIMAKISRHERLYDWYCTDQGIDAIGEGGVPEITIIEHITDLVDRRNCVSHRGLRSDSILGISEMQSVSSFVEAFCAALYSVVVGAYLDLRHCKNGGAKPVLLKEGPFKDGEVVVVDMPRSLAARGKPLFGVSGSGSVRWGRILGLQVDGQEVGDHPGSGDGEVNVGLKVDFRCTKGMTLYVLAREDDAVWSPLSAALAVGSAP